MTIYSSILPSISTSTSTSTVTGSKWFLLLWATFLWGCAEGEVLNPEFDLDGSPTQMSTAAPAPSLETAFEPTVPAAGEWAELSPGFEYRRTRWALPTESVSPEVAELVEMRIEPERFEFDIGYTPRASRSLNDWAEREDALLTLNGGFFTEEMLATGMIVAQGEVSGVSYTGQAGMFIIHDDLEQFVGQRQRLEIRDLDRSRFAAAEAVWGGLQTFPILVRPEQRQAVLPNQFPESRARRTVVGLDQMDRLLFIFATDGRMTLSDISHYLATSDLELVYALNLDGGSSTGYVLEIGEVEEVLPPFVRVPSVIYVLSK